MAEDTTQTDETVATDDVATSDETTTDDAQVEDNQTEAPAAEAPAAEAPAAEAPATEAPAAEAPTTEAPAAEAPEAETAAPAQTASDDDSSDDDDSDSDNASESRARPASSELSESLSPLGEVSEERKEVEDGRSYEIIYIVRPAGDDSIQNVTNRVRTMIEEGKGAVDNVRVSESRRLAYPIDKENEGSYVVINARFHKSHLDEINRFFQLEDAVLRHMILREDDEA